MVREITLSEEQADLVAAYLDDGGPVPDSKEFRAAVGSLWDRCEALEAALRYIRQQAHSVLSSKVDDANDA